MAIRLPVARWATIGTRPVQRVAATPAMTRIARFFVAAACLGLLAACASAPGGHPALDNNAQSPVARTHSPVQQAIEVRLNPTRTSVRGQRIDHAIAEYYQAHDDKPGWFDHQGVPRAARIKTLQRTLARADRQGLIDDDYGVSRLLDRLLQRPAEPTHALSADQRAQADVQVSRALVGYAIDLHDGRVFDDRVRTQWVKDATATDYAAVLSRALSSGDIDQALAQLAPPHAGYTRLVAALADYRAIEKAGGWPWIAAGPVLKVGMHDARLPALRRRLRTTGDWPGASEPDVPGLPARPTHASTLFSAKVSRALAHYQRRNGLHDDGRLGAHTRAALNVPAAGRVAQIELNLERWRWLPADLGRRYILVNIPDYRLLAVDHGQIALRMNVIVGKSYDNRATPVFADQMRYIVFRPFWNVPYSIATKEILPKARADHGYLARRHYQIVRVFGPNAQPLPVTDAHLDDVAAGRLRIRQDGGPTNALGLVKFMFPNQYAVYLHSTPANRLFSRTQRDFSHGCVRVAQPEALASFALKGRPQWTPEHIHKAMFEGGWKHVNLAQPLPVYLMYWTAFVTDDGVQFRPDLYHHDVRLQRAMQQATPGRTL